jgi:hypothetical protein
MPVPAPVPGNGVLGAGLRSPSNSLFFICETEAAGVGDVAGTEKPTTEEVGRAFRVEDDGPEALDEGCRREAHDFLTGC